MFWELFCDADLTAHFTENARGNDWEIQGISMLRSRTNAQCL